MNAMVAARVPIEVKEQGGKILEEIGSNPTDLINKAYAYVLKYGALPGDLEASQNGAGERQSVSSEMLDELRWVYEEISLPLEDAWGSTSFKEIRDQLEGDRCARFA